MLIFFIVLFTTSKTHSYFIVLGIFHHLKKIINNWINARFKWNVHKNPVDSHWSVYEVRDLIFLNFYKFTCCSSSHGFILSCHLLPFFTSHSKYEQIKCFSESELLFCETYSDSSVLTVWIMLPWTS